MWTVCGQLTISSDLDAVLWSDRSASLHKSARSQTRLRYIADRVLRSSYDMYQRAKEEPWLCIGPFFAGFVQHNLRNFGPCVLVQLMRSSSHTVSQLALLCIALALPSITAQMARLGKIWIKIWPDLARI